MPGKGNTRAGLFACASFRGREFLPSGAASWGKAWCGRPLAQKQLYGNRPDAGRDLLMKGRSFYKRLMIVLLCPLLAGCPVRIFLDVSNMSPSSIGVIGPYSDDVRVIIEPGRVTQVTTNQECIKIIADGVLYEFSFVTEPLGYTNDNNPGPLSGATFTPEKKLFIYAEGMDESDWLEMTRGCPSVETASE